MNRKLVFLAVMVSLLSSCSSFRPLPIVEPPAQDLAKKRTVPDYQRGGLLPAENISEAIENLKIYGDSYQSTSDRLRGDEYTSSDVGFGGGLLGVVGGLAKSFEAAAAGAIIMSGSSVASQRYQFLVQAGTMKRHRMRCIVCIQG